MVAAFGVDKVSRNPARFDLKKLTAINGVKIRRAGPGRVRSRGCCRSWSGAGLLASPVSDDAAASWWPPPRRWCRSGSATLVEAAELLGVPARRPTTTSSSTRPPRRRCCGAGREPVLDAAVPSLAELRQWTTADIEEALQAALVDGLGLKPRVAFGPVRVAVTGRTVSPPLFESIELLGAGADAGAGCGRPVPVWGAAPAMG